MTTVAMIITRCRMKPTPPLAKQADDACVFARGAKARHVKSKDKFKHAARLRALALIYELRKSGHHVSRKHEQALRG